MTSISQITETGKIPVVVWNESEHECLLKAGDRIGTASKAEVINQVTEGSLENETGEEWRPSEEIKAIGNEISREEHEKIKQVLNNFNDVFSKNDEDVGEMSFEHEIELDAVLKAPRVYQVLYN